MIKTSKKILTLILSLILILIPATSLALGDNGNTQCITRAQFDLISAQRKLWIDHISWTRSAITSILLSLEDKEPVVERLLKNQEDIGNSIKPYFGGEAGDKLTSLLKEHISLAAQVTEAVKNGDKDGFEKYNKLWYENADKISQYLSSINPNFSEKELNNMLYKHLQLLTEQVLAIKGKEWKSDISAYDRGENHMIMFADMISEGIMKQFPQKFK